MAKTADVSGGGVILTGWGNEVRDRTVQVFASIAERDAAYPIPNRGQCCYIYSNDAAEGFYCFDGTAWRPPWNTSWGQVGLGTKSADQINITQAAGTVDITNLAVSFTAVPNRRYRALLTAQISYFGSASGGWGFHVLLTDGSNTVLQDVRYLDSTASGLYFPVATAIYFTASGAYTVKTRSYVEVAGQNMSYWCSGRPAYLVVEDLGPTGVPS